MVKEKKKRSVRVEHVCNSGTITFYSDSEEIGSINSDLGDIQYWERVLNAGMKQKNER